MQSAIRQRVSFYCLVDNCQELKLEERERAEEREKRKNEGESRVVLVLCSIESIPRTDFAKNFQFA